MYKPPSYHYVTHRDTDEQAYRINEGKYSGIVWKYEDVSFPVYDDEGKFIAPAEAAQIPLTFNCDVLYNPTDEDLSTGEFEKVIGDILINIIEESLEHEQIKFRTDDSDEFTL